MLMVFDPPNRQIAKTTLWASPRNPDASFDQVLPRPAFCGKSYEGIFPDNNSFCATYFPEAITKAVVQHTSAVLLVPSYTEEASSLCSTNVF